MSKKAKAEYLSEIKPRYNKANKAEKQKILNEFSQVCGYNCKYAIHLLNKKEEGQTKKEETNSSHIVMAMPLEKL